MHQVNYWVCTAGTYRSTSITWKGLYRLTSITTSSMLWLTCLMKCVLAGWWLPWTWEFKRALHYYNEGYDSDKDYRLPPHITRPVHIYSVFSAEASFNLAVYTTTQCQLSPFTPRCPRGLPFWVGICQCLTFDETPPPTFAADWGWRKPTNSRPSVGWGPGTRQQGIPLHPWDS